MHEDQRDVDVALVRRLVADGDPESVGLDVRAVRSSGTMNAMFRLGESLAVRVPLRNGPDALAELERESAASAELSMRLPVPVPSVRRVALSAPGGGPQVAWSMQTWLPGAIAGTSGSAALAVDLADLVLVLRAMPTRGRSFTGTYRGGALIDHDAWVEECLERNAGIADVAAAGRLWRRLRILPRPATDVMCHGDLTPPNLLVDDRGRLCGLLDLGTYGPADPALDLVCAWHGFEAGPRGVLRTRLGVGDAEWARGQAWALEQALGLSWYYAASNPSMSALGRSTLTRVLAAPAR